MKKCKWKMADMSRKKHKDYMKKIYNFKINIQEPMHRQKINCLSRLIGWKKYLHMCKGDEYIDAHRPKDTYTPIYSLLN